MSKTVPRESLERRRFLRVPASLDVEHRPVGSTARPAKAKAADISVGGMLLLSRRDLHIGKPLDLLVLATTLGVQKRIRGVVRSSQKIRGDPNYRIGIEFEAPLPLTHDPISMVLPPFVRLGKGQQNRRFVRLKECLPLRYRSDARTPWQEAETFDISVGGLKFLAHHKIAEDGLISVEMELGPATSIRARARVVGVTRDRVSNLYVTSAAFVRIAATSAAALDHYISRHARG